MASRDIANIAMLHYDNGLSLDVFRGAVKAAERLGHTVSIREIRDGMGYLHSIVASVSPTPETET